MTVPRYLVDTNILLRFLIGEPAPQAEAAKEIFARASAEEIALDISPLIVAEAFYTLHSFYQVEKKETATKLLVLLDQPGIKLRDAPQVTDALERLQTVKVGFADAFLAAVAADEDIPVLSFDRGLDKFKDITRHEPAVSKKAHG